MFKINLVPEVQEKKNQVKKMNTMSVTVAAVIMGATVITLIFFGLAQATLNFQISGTEKKIEEVKAESEQYKSLEDAVISLEKGLKGIKEIYGGKNQWGVLLSRLEAATPANVKYTALKLSAGSAEVKLEADSVDSFSKLVQSYKRYQVVTVSGSGVSGETLTTRIDGADSGSVIVRQDGTWKASLKIDVNKNHEIKVGSNEKFVTVSYTAESQKLEATDGASAQLSNLFTNVETKEYQKQNGKVTATVNFNYNGGALW